MKRMLAVLTLTIAVVVLLPQLATAGVSTVAYFTRNPAAAPPPGGIEVANGLDGVISTGAVRAIEDGSTIESATLNLTPSGSGVNAAAVALRACPALGAFKAGRGTLDERPKADCETAMVALVRDGTGVYSGDVTPLLKGPAPAVAIVPAMGAGVFQMAFAPPALDVVVRSSESDSGSGSGSSVDDFDTSEFNGSSGGGSGSSGGGGSDASTFDTGGSFSGSSSGSGSSSNFSSSPIESGSSFGSNSFNTPGAPIDASAAPVVAAAPDDVAAAAADAGGAALPTRQRLRARTASASDSGGSTVQFVFFVLTALVIGTAAGFGRNRLVTARA